jgi:enoyl-CoA hydratase/carnithine racemase
MRQSLEFLCLHIGLNKLMVSIVGQGKADKLTLYGRSASAEQAMKIGLVDTVVPHADALEPSVVKLATEIFRLPDSGRAATKSLLRKVSRWTLDRR